MRPAQVPPQWRGVLTRMPKQPSASVRRRLKSKTAHSNLLSRVLVPRRFSKWLAAFAQRVATAITFDSQTFILAAMHTPVARFTDDLCGLVRMQTGHPELLLPTSLPEIDARHTIGEQTDGGGLADKAVAWMLAPVFFCCVVAEKAKPPQTWEATEVFSRVVVAYMLRLFVMVADLTGGGLQQQTVQRLKEGK